MKNPFAEPTTTYKPILFPDFVDIAVDHERLHWHEGEAELSPDVKDWRERMTKEEVVSVTNILKLFTQSDVEVGKFYYELLIPYYKNNEIRNMLGSFAAREAIHQRAYALLNDTLGLPESEYQAFLEYEEMAEKVVFMQDTQCVDPVSAGLSKVRAIINEGVSLFASFAMLLNYSRTGRMTGMCSIVEWSVRDETMHVEGLTALQLAEFKYFKEEHSLDIKKMIQEAVQGMCQEIYLLECKFIDLALGVKNGEEYKAFVAFIINLRITRLGYPAPFPEHTVNPLRWMADFLNNKDLSNFFEKRVTQYSKANFVGEKWPKVI